MSAFSINIVGVPFIDFAGKLYDIFESIKTQIHFFLIFVQISGIAWISLNFDDYSDFQPKITLA